MHILPQHNGHASRGEQTVENREDVTKFSGNGGRALFGNTSASVLLERSVLDLPPQATWRPDQCLQAVTLQTLFTLRLSRTAVVRLLTVLSRKLRCTNTVSCIVLSAALSQLRIHLSVQQFNSSVSFCFWGGLPDAGSPACKGRCARFYWRQDALVNKAKSLKVGNGAHKETGRRPAHLA